MSKLIFGDIIKNKVFKLWSKESVNYINDKFKLIKIFNNQKIYLKSNFLILNTIELSDIFLPFYQKDTTSFIKYFICIGIFSFLYYINNLWIKKNDQDEKQNQKNIDLDIPLYSNNNNNNPNPRKPIPKEFLKFIFILKELEKLGYNLEKLEGLGWDLEHIVYALKNGLKRKDMLNMFDLEWSFNNWYFLSWNFDSDVIRRLIETGITNDQLNKFWLIFGITVGIIILLNWFFGGGGGDNG